MQFFFTTNFWYIINTLLTQNLKNSVLHLAFSWHLTKIFFFLTISNLFNSSSFLFPTLPFNISKGGKLYPEAVILNTAVNLHLSFPYVIISICFLPLISTVSLDGFSK